MSPLTGFNEDFTNRAVTSPVEAKASTSPPCEGGEKKRFREKGVE